jgi:hypothetical protein
MKDQLERLFRETVHATLIKYYNGAKKGVSEISVEETRCLLENEELGMHHHKPLLGM